MAQHLINNSKGQNAYYRNRNNRQNYVRSKELKFHPNINIMRIFYVDDNDDELDAKHICVI